MHSPDDPLPAPPWWSNTWAAAQPIGWALREAFPGRWLRIHSLTDSKRYAETEEEWRELRGRHTDAASLLFENGEDGFLIVPSPYAGGEVFRGLGLVPTRAVPEYRPDEDEPPTGPYHAAPFRWDADGFWPILETIAGDAARAVFVTGDASRIYAPYDGGADLFFTDAGLHSNARTALSASLSPRPDGL